MQQPAGPAALPLSRREESVVWSRCCPLYQLMFPRICAKDQMGEIEATPSKPSEMVFNFIGIVNASIDCNASTISECESDRYRYRMR
ncbi:hypothetical protein O6P43_024492 [Quillaja saponaria]|uniref:Uncharacterized protein n=1 Tax=Quillaja saponaria TaxID=32244 RepID=A0AAD7L755_QUISA|nr:hypothetical protein O6P43_024492 [Quillaja saponaria]